MMLGQLPSIAVEPSSLPTVAVADVLAWEATTQQSDAYTEALTIVHEIETNPAIGIPTPNPLLATDSDVYAMDLEIEHVTSEQITMPNKRINKDDSPTPLHHCTVPDERRKKQVLSDMPCVWNLQRSNGRVTQYDTQLVGPNVRRTQTFKCSHCPCEVLIFRRFESDTSSTNTVKRRSVGPYIIYKLRESLCKQRSDDVPHSRADAKGIHPLFHSLASNRIRDGRTPRQIIQEIRQLVNVAGTAHGPSPYPEDLANPSVLPLYVTIQQIQDLSKNMKKHETSTLGITSGTIVKVLDLYNEFTKRKVLSSADWFGKANSEMNKCRVLAAYTTKDSKDADYAGCVFTTTRLFQKTIEYIDNLTALYNEAKIVLIGDGTRGFDDNNWPFLIVGVTTRHFDVHHCEIRRKFVPSVFVYNKGESSHAYHMARVCIEFLITAVYKRTATIAACIGDHSGAIVNGLNGKSKSQPEPQPTQALHVQASTSLPLSSTPTEPPSPDPPSVPPSSAFELIPVFSDHGVGNVACIDQVDGHADDEDYNCTHLDLAPIIQGTPRLPQPQASIFCNDRAHMMRKTLDHIRAQLQDDDGALTLELIRSDVTMATQTRTHCALEAFLEVMYHNWALIPRIAQLIVTRGKSFIDWHKNTYGTPPWDTWNDGVGAIHQICFSPDSQALESYNGSLKKAHAHLLRASKERLVGTNGVLDQMCVDASMEFGNVTMTQHLPYLDSKYVTIARAIVRSAKYFVITGKLGMDASYTRREPHDWSEGDTIFINHVAFKDMPVTSDRVMDHLRIDGAHENDINIPRTTADFASKYLSLHICTFRHNAWTCMCKTFGIEGVCPHTIAASHISGHHDVTVFLAAIACNRPSGRKRKHVGCRDHQPNDVQRHVTPHSLQCVPGRGARRPSSAEAPTDTAHDRVSGRDLIGKRVSKFFHDNRHTNMRRGNYVGVVLDPHYDDTKSLAFNVWFEANDYIDRDWSENEVVQAVQHYNQLATDHIVVNHGGLLGQAAHLPPTLPDNPRDNPTTCVVDHIPPGYNLVPTCPPYKALPRMVILYKWEIDNTCRWFKGTVKSKCNMKSNPNSDCTFNVHYPTDDTGCASVVEHTLSADMYYASSSPRTCPPGTWCVVRHLTRSSSPHPGP